MGKAARKTSVLKAYARGWSAFEKVLVTEKMRKEHPHLAHCESIWANNRIEAQIFYLATPIGGVTQISMIRHGNVEALTWTEIQRAIHELCGPEATAVEIYPAIDKEWVTTLNLRTVWVLPSTWEIPFGLHLPGAWGKPA